MFFKAHPMYRQYRVGLRSATQEVFDGTLYVASTPAQGRDVAIELIEAHLV
jgi:hypothetical protein